MTIDRSIRALRGALAVAAIACCGLACAQAPTYNVGSTPTGIPFTFLDVKTNTI